VRILFLHGWRSVPGGVKPMFLARHGHEVLNPALPDEDFAEAVRIAQAEFDRHRPDAVVGSSRGGAVAINLNSADARLVLLCPAWRKYGTVRTVKPGTVILHSRADDVVPFADSEELVRLSGLTASTLIEVGTDHRLADPEPLAAMLRACGATVAAGADTPVNQLVSNPPRPTFGVREEDRTYTERRAAYGVVLGAGRTVAAVQGQGGRFWLPGGGSRPGESAEETLTREVREELARSVRLIHRIGEATQYFYAVTDDRHYRMAAVFFRADFGEELDAVAEHDISWLPLDRADTAFFHECHTWAVAQAVASS
jgi:8-oxo-dGTP pyrophosphatase MutT (NUDIX family)